MSKNIILVTFPGRFFPRFAQPNHRHHLYSSPSEKEEPQRVVSSGCRSENLNPTQNQSANTVSLKVEEHPSVGDDGENIETSNGKEVVSNEEPLDIEPYVGMQFETEDSAKVFYDGYATHLGFIMRVDAFRRSMRDGLVVWRRLVCNKEGFRKCRPRRSENRKPRVITREGCKAMIVVKKEKTGNWVVTRFIKEHNHPLVVAPANHRRTVLLLQTPDEKDVKIRELTGELQRERKRSAALQEQLDMVLKDMEEHSNHLSRNIDSIVQNVKEIESKRVVLSSS